MSAQTDNTSMLSVEEISCDFSESGGTINTRFKVYLPMKSTVFDVLRFRAPENSGREHIFTRIPARLSQHPWCRFFLCQKVRTRASKTEGGRRVWFVDTIHETPYPIYEAPASPAWQTPKISYSYYDEYGRVNMAYETPEDEEALLPMVNPVGEPVDARRRITRAVASITFCAATYGDDDTFSPQNLVKYQGVLNKATGQTIDGQPTVSSILGISVEQLQAQVMSCLPVPKLYLSLDPDTGEITSGKYWEVTTKIAFAREGEDFRWAEEALSLNQKSGDQVVPINRAGAPVSSPQPVKEDGSAWPDENGVLPEDYEPHVMTFQIDPARNLTDIGTDFDAFGAAEWIAFSEEHAKDGGLI